MKNKNLQTALTILTIIGVSVGLGFAIHNALQGKCAEFPGGTKVNC
jgi:hypothetical protein